MPALPAVASTLRVQLKHTVGADVDVLNRFYLLYSGTAPTGAGLNTMAAAVESAWASDLKTYASSTVTLTEIIIEDLTSSTSAIGTWSGSTAGTRAGTFQAGACVLINFTIARRYRGGKPRVYLPYLVGGDVTTPQLWNTTTTAALLTAWNTFMTAVIAAGPSGTTITGQVSVSYYEGFTNYMGPTGRYRARSTVKSGTELPIVPDAVTSTTVNAKVASQRRRTGQKR